MCFKVGLISRFLQEQLCLNVEIKFTNYFISSYLLVFYEPNKWKLNMKIYNKNHKLFNLLRTLTAKEQRQLKKFLKSPFFVIREDVQLLYHTLLVFVKKEQPFPALEQIFEKVFVGKKYNSLLLRGTMSDLLELVEHYLLISIRKEDDIQNQLLLAELYRKRNLEKNYKSTFKQLEKLMESQQLENADFYKDQLAFQTEQMKFQSANKRTDHLFLQEISDTHDILYLSQKLKNTCAQLSHQLVYKTDYDYGLLDYLLEHIEQEEYLTRPSIAIYYYCFRFLKGDNDQLYFQKFKTTFFQHKNKFTKEDLEAPYRLAINFCIRKLNDGQGLYLKEGFELYKEGLQEGILLENNLIPRFTFNNAIALAILLKEFDWVSSFIDQSKAILEEGFRAQTVSFNLARLAFAQGDFSSALIHLQSVEYKDLINVLIVKMMTIKIYYEMEETDILYSNLDSFGQFIRRRDVSDYHRNNFLAIIRIIKKILNTPDYNKEAMVLIQQEVLSAKILSEKHWLVEKIQAKIN